MAFERLSARRARNQQIYGPEAWQEFGRVRRSALRPSRAWGLAGAFLVILSAALDGTPGVIAAWLGSALLVASMALLVPYAKTMARESRKLRDKRRTWERDHPAA